MECSADVVLQVRDMDALHCCLERIRTLFNVRSEIVSLDDAGCCVPEPGLAGYPPPVGRSVRLKLWADTASKPSALKASKELLATACESVSAADALSAMRCGAFSSSGSVDSTAGGPGRPDSVRRRRTLESEDSSYDSDTENPPDGGSSTTTSAVGTPCGTTTTTIGGSRQHEDVSRTVSETLGAEFAEYVTAGPQYASRLEFAVKLGYTEAQVQQALRRLGPQPAQNELLAELVRLGAREQQQHQSSGGGTTAVAAVLAGVEGGGTTRTGDHHSTTDDPLRPIVIDGSNVAMSHGNKEVFSCRGIQLAVEWFRARGHTDISVFVPSWRKEASRAETPIKDQEILLQLEKERLLFFTPSRNVGGKRMVCYEDRYILKMAAQTDGVVVSNDNYRDLVAESLDFKRVVEERLLMYTFVNDRFMPPDDPLGRHGPSLDAFLRKSGPVPPPEGPPSCPYGKKCTYGNKCKYYHPERGNLPQKSVTERLAEQARLQLQEVKARSSIKSRDSSPGGELLKTKSLPPGATEAMLPKKKMPLSRTKSSVPSSSLLGADLLEADGGGHLSVAKRLSDPDSGLGAFSLPKGSPVLSPGGASGAGDDAIGSGNLHRKLQRQLTLNPAYDPRLYQLRAAASASAGLIAPPPPAVSLAEAVRASSQESLQPPHRALGRLASDSGLMAGGWAPLAATQHPEVTRIASAPDSTRRSQQAAAMQRLSSTSDTRLDAFPLAGAAPPPVPAGPYPSYPGLSPHATGWGGLPMGRPPPPHLEVNPAPFDTASPRYRLYYHLSSIFPEEQVRAAMDLCPEETNPQKVCAAILAMFPKG